MKLCSFPITYLIYLNYIEGRMYLDMHLKVAGTKMTVLTKDGQYWPSFIVIQYWWASNALILMLFQKVAILNTKQY